MYKSSAKFASTQNTKIEQFRLLKLSTLQFCHYHGYYIVSLLFAPVLSALSALLRSVKRLEGHPHLSYLRVQLAIQHLQSAIAKS
jgi:hypothetical protein